MPKILRLLIPLAFLLGPPRVEANLLQKFLEYIAQRKMDRAVTPASPCSVALVEDRPSFQATPEHALLVSARPGKLEPFIQGVTDPQVLFLSDSPFGLFSLAEKYADLYEDVTFFKTDFDMDGYGEGGKQRDNLVPVQLDNNLLTDPKGIGGLKKETAYKDLFNKKYDVIALRKGICFCDDKTTSCCGIKSDPQVMAQFIGNLSSLLNMKNKNARGIFHGGGSETIQNREYWESVAKLIETHHPKLQVKINFGRDSVELYTSPK